MTSTPTLAPYQSWRGTDAPAALKPLTGIDLGQGRSGEEAGALKPLKFSDFVPGSKTKVTDEHQQLVENTQKWVAQTFYGTILKQMRQDPFRSEMFDGGRGGQAFGEMFDQHLADHMARASGNKLVKSLVRKLEARKAYAKAHPNAAGAGSEINQAKQEGRAHVAATLRA